MKHTIHLDLSYDDMVATTPSKYRRKLLASLSQSLDRAGRYDLLLFSPGISRIVLSAAVGKALDGVPGSRARIIAVAYGFSAEGLWLLEERGALPLTQSEYDWTDASYQSVRRPSR